jgi:hypothetical protein
MQASDAQFEQGEHGLGKREHEPPEVTVAKGQDAGLSTRPQGGRTPRGKEHAVFAHHVTRSPFHRGRGGPGKQHVDDSVGHREDAVGGIACVAQDLAVFEVAALEHHGQHFQVARGNAPEH